MTKRRNKIQNCIKDRKKEKGITIISLIITIIILIILAGITIGAFSGENGAITKASEAKIMTELSEYKEQVDLYITGKMIENIDFEPESLIAGKTKLMYNTKNDDEGNIKTVIENISDKYFEKLEIIKGELLINTKDRLEIKVAQAVGIQVNPYDITEEGELLSSEGNLLLMDENGTVTIPNSVTKIGEGAFADLEGLKTIIIPGTCKEIEKNAFIYNKTLEKVIMQEGVEIIGVGAFSNCTNLKEVQMPDSVISIGSQAFYLDSNLKSINLSKGIRNIPSYAFSGTRLTEIILHEGIEVIEAYAFSNCTNLETINLPESLQSINGTAFNNSKNLKNINIDKNNQNFKLTNDILIGNKETEMIIILESAVKDNSFTVPEGVKKLRAGQINHFTQLQTVYIPKSVTLIESDFINNNIENVIIDENNTKYETYQNGIYIKENGERKELVRYYGNESIVTIEEGIERIGDYAFKSKDLNKVSFPQSLKSVSNHIFSGCKNITSISLGENVNYIASLFLYNSKVTELLISENNVNYTVYNNVLYNKDMTKLIFPIDPQNTMTSFEILEGVEEIGDYAFHTQANLENITIPNTVTKIGVSFNYCNKLTKIEIPNSIKEISTGCFGNSNNLREIIIHKKKGEISGSPWGCIFGDRAIFWDE